MFAEAAVEGAAFRNTQSVSNVGGKAAIVLTSDFAAGDRVDWRLYRSAIEQRQAISKVLRKKPGADL
jgi:hypothetical protein